MVGYNGEHLVVSSNEIQKIRPAGRHILTIGRDLIKDNQAAIIELVKNAYDADATKVDIFFDISQDKNSIKISIKDNGHGMTKDVVINKWLVPSTDDKLQRKTSPKGRILQGRKGVGRYAASILGEDLLLKTIDTEHNQTEIYLQWTSFEKAQYLDDIDILVATSRTTQNSCTELVINGDASKVQEWLFIDERKVKTTKYSEMIDALITELQKLISPIKKLENNDTFSIIIHIKGIKNYKEFIKEEIRPIPINDLYDYRLYGYTTDSHTIELTYSNQKSSNLPDEFITLDIDNYKDVGKVEFDIRVYDRDSKDIYNLIDRGLKKFDGTSYNFNEARNILNTLNGISIYRNNFRIRPYGEPGFDWLLLDKRRVDNPSLRIGSNQVIGYIYIESEENSHLEEKSARDGLKENEYFNSFRNIIIEALKELEARRFSYRRETDKIKESQKLAYQVDSLINFDEIKSEIKKQLTSAKVSPQIQTSLLEVIQKEEYQKSKIVEEINKKIAIYQGQATLGKIINVVLHEGRKPLNFFRNEISNVDFWIKELDKHYSRDTLDEIVNIVSKFKTNSNALINLFGRLDPLAAGKRGNKKDFYLKKVIEESFAVYNEDLIKEHISLEISCDENITLYGWQSDFYIIFTNIIDNSIYWLCKRDVTNKQIKVKVYRDLDCYAIEILDNGPGIDKKYIESEIIFEPEFSLKTYGTGLGLALAGEAASRNNYKLEAIECDNGAFFKLISKGVADDK